MRKFVQIIMVLLVMMPPTGGWLAQTTSAMPTAVAASLVPDHDSGPTLTPEELLEYKPNEIGVVPVFMYHNIAEDPPDLTQENEHLYRTADELYADLQWLYDRNFYLIGMEDFVNGTIDIPAGKHPAILTFDDSSSMHLSFQVDDNGVPLKDENGEYMPTPDCAVGIIEAFAKDHPDFGKTAHFAVIPLFKFSWPEYAQDDLIGAKLQWLLDHGYEIGNHTSDHADLAEATVDDFARSIAEPVIWAATMVDPNSDGFAMNILTLPFGAYPEGGWDDEKLDYLKNGYTWEGTEIKIDAALLVCCGASPSRWNGEWAPLWIPRIRGDDPDIASFGDYIDNGWITLYTSDGDPDTIAIPWPLPSEQVGEVDFDGIKEAGLKIVRYDPDSGRIYPPREKHRLRGYTTK
ncbi:MAG: hypothetical protein KC435_14765 [Thermomicrobiales bacterium]|nr:hypothetical protein [Thermomicrobiales bacterium]